MVEQDQLKNATNFLFQVGILNKTPRSGFHFLGSGEQSVAEHNNRVIFAGYLLSTMTPGVDIGKVMQMCLFHDIHEARTSDLNYVHQQYVTVDEEKAIEDASANVPNPSHLRELLREYKERITIESQLAKDADILEWLLTLKEQLDIGNARAAGWIATSKKRLLTEQAKSLAEIILQTDSNDWWAKEQDESWWVNRNKKSLK